jgi:rhodanese-related sulfurtransferase
VTKKHGIQKRRSMKLINVLSQEAYNDCHIKGSINVPYNELSDYARNLPKDAELILYCASYSCPLSRKAYQLLKSEGFTNLVAYEGGIAEWYSLGYPTEGPAKMDYLHEHHEQGHSVEGIKTMSAEELKKRLSL